MPGTLSNPLLSDREVEFVLHELLEVESLCALPAFADHSRETFDLFLANTRRVAREVLFPAYRPMDAAPPVFADGRVTVHPAMHAIHARLVELGVIAATRPYAVGGAQLPAVVHVVASMYLGAGNGSAMGYVMLATGAARLIESFGDEALRATYMPRMYAGEWSGTMALTEPQAGSSLADITTRATPTSEGHYLIRGSKIFISGADHDLTDNVVNMTLARIDGAPAGTRGVSLFVVPKKRPGPTGALEPNDVHVTGVIHKIGWRGLPSLALGFGEQGDCRGWLVGARDRGLAHMFQMMNEARLYIGAAAAATASVAYHEALSYARTRPQGRAVASRDPASPQLPIVEHADVRRMLLRQKAIVEGSLALVATTARYADLAHHAERDEDRARAQRLLDLLTPVAKTFPAEKGFESNALSVQVHGGYGYSSEYLPEAWLRDQKLNSIHEGTTGIQGLDLLGRKVVAGGGASLAALLDEVSATVARARSAGVEPAWCAQLEQASGAVAELTAQLGALGAGGDVDAMLRHSADYLELFSVFVVAWLWLASAAVARERMARAAGDDAGFYEGKLRAAQYWFATEVPRVAQLAALCSAGDDSYAAMRPEWF